MEDNGAAANAAPGGALMTRPVLAPSVFAPQAPGALTPREVCRAGMDRTSLFHSFRRRWLTALCLGLLAGLLGAGALYWLFPLSASAITQFQVDSSEGGILEQSLREQGNFDIFRKTQVVLVQSPLVLNAALNDPRLSSLAIFNDVPQQDRAKWLRKEIMVQFPQESEILQISMTGEDRESEDLKTIVDAVARAYMEEVVFKEQIRRLKPRDILQSSYRKLSEEIARKTKVYYDLLKELGKSQVYDGSDPDVVAYMGEMRDLQEKVGDQQQKLFEAQMDFQFQRAQYTDPQILEARIDEAVSADPMLQQLEQRKMMYEMYVMELNQSAKSGKSSSSKQYQKLVDSMAQQIAQRRAEMKQAYMQKQQSEPDLNLKMLMQQFQTIQGAYAGQIQAAEKRLAEIQETLRERNLVDADLAMKSSELEGLTRVQASIAERIEQWDVEAERPQRINQVTQPEITPGIDRLQRYILSGIGGLACFALTAFGVSYLEFRNRRLNNPEQVDEGLGIRVIGTLPSLAGRKSLAPNNPLVAQLTESIDSVRTALMHESTTKRRQIVLVTSATASEGRTTVASQLAASLARAGRRTLLVDGDLRRPALHSLFGLPLEAGLCEVLRAETEAADAIRPTHAEGLWVMTAGYCDADAVHALATDQVQPIFDKLRSDYDFIIIDGAPVLGLSDSLLFGQHCDGAILSVLRDYTNVPKLFQAAELLRSVGIRLIGSVVNGVATKADRRVTHLQAVASKADTKRLEKTGA